jgi:predicted kinase
VLDAALSNLAVLASLELPPDLLPTVEDLREWTLQEHARIAPALARRVADGFVRECHGDLHLGNIVQLDGAPVPFDAIEFNDELRWIDPMADIAFTAMDLERHGLDAHANRFLNAYLEESGDYGGVAVLRFYEVYRALVRAKIGSIRLGQAGVESHEKMAVRTSVRGHVLLAQRLSCRSTPRLVVMHGLSGSGKTVMSESLAASIGAIRIRSDVERKRLGGLGPLARSGSAVGAGLYSARRTARTYDRLAELAESVLAEGYPVIVDATFLRRAERARFRDIAERAKVAFTIASCTAPADVLRRRLRARALGMNDASEADLAVLDLQLATQEPLGAAERDRAIYL